MINKEQRMAATKAPNIGTKAPIATTNPQSNEYGKWKMVLKTVTNVPRIKHSKIVPPI